MILAFPAMHHRGLRFKPVFTFNPVWIAKHSLQDVVADDDRIARLPIDPWSDSPGPGWPLMISANECLKVNGLDERLIG